MQQQRQQIVDLLLLLVSTDAFVEVFMLSTLRLICFIGESCSIKTSFRQFHSLKIRQRAFFV